MRKSHLFFNSVSLPLAVSGTAIALLEPSSANTYGALILWVIFGYTIRHGFPFLRSTDWHKGE